MKNKDLLNRLKIWSDETYIAGEAYDTIISLQAEVVLLRKQLNDMDKDAHKRVMNRKTIK